MKTRQHLLMIPLICMFATFFLAGQKCEALESTSAPDTKWELDDIDNGEEATPRPTANASDKKPQKKPAKADATKKPLRTKYHFVMRRNTKETISLDSTVLKSPIKWSVSNRKIVRIISKSNKKCKVRLLKNGKATIKAKAKNATLQLKITVKSGTAFTKAWCKQWVKDYITKDMSSKDKLIAASSFITASGIFRYGSTSKPEDVISKKMGTCVSGGKLLVEMCKAMGFKAKLRFAAKDKMSRYPAFIRFASQHHNVEVKIKGKKYYIDGTPGLGVVYLCTSKKTVYSRNMLDAIPW